MMETVSSMTSSTDPHTSMMCSGHRRPDIISNGMQYTYLLGIKQRVMTDVEIGNNLYNILLIIIPAIAGYITGMKHQGHRCKKKYDKTPSPTT